MARAAASGLGLAVLLVTAVHAPALEQPQVTISADAGAIARSQPLGLTIVYAWPQGWHPLEPPSPEAAFARTTVLACTGPERDLAGGEERWIYRLRIQPPPGMAYVSPPLRLRLRAPDQDMTTVEADPVVVLIGGDALAAGLPTLVPARQRAWGWWLASGAAALLATLVIIAWRSRGSAPATPMATLLRELERSRTAADVRAGAGQASLALRQFAGERGGFTGLAATPAEIRQLLAGHCPEAHARELERLLVDLEALRWRRGQPPPESVAQLCHAARTWATSLPATEAGT